MKRVKNAVGRGTATDESVTENASAREGSKYPLTTAETEASGSNGEKAADETHSAEIGQVFGILRNQRRRNVLRYLTMVEREISLSELAEQIAAWECEKDVSQINSQERKRVYVGLYQCHLPKMADVGAIRYNKPRGKIEAGENFEQFRFYLPPEEDATKEPDTDGRLSRYVAELGF